MELAVCIKQPLSDSKHASQAIACALSILKGLDMTITSSLSHKVVTYIILLCKSMSSYLRYQKMLTVIPGINIYSSILFEIIWPI